MIVICWQSITEAVKIVTSDVKRLWKAAAGKVPSDGVMVQTCYAVSQSGLKLAPPH